MRVGIVGIGNMGLAIALRLRERGHTVEVRDIDGARETLAAHAGCHVAAGPVDMASRCDLVVVVVVDGDQSRDVVLGPDGLTSAMRPGSAVMLCPTIGPADTEALAQGLAAAGVDWIDAPMSGGPVRARAGTMSLMVACDDPVFQRWRAVLEDMASPVFRVGSRAGDGARTKLVNNLLAAINLAGAAEALALAERMGLDPATTLSVIEQSSGQSWIGSDRMRRALAGQTAVQAHVGLLAKDSTLAMSSAGGTGLTLTLGQAAMQCFADAAAAGLAREDDSALWQWLCAGRSLGA